MSDQELAYRIRLARGNRSRKELARLLGKSPKTIERWEKNISRPSRGDLLLLARVLHVNPEWLLTGKGPMYASEPPSDTFIPVPLYTIVEVGPYTSEEEIFKETRSGFLQVWPGLPFMDPLHIGTTEVAFFALHLTNDIFKQFFRIGDIIICRKFTDPPAFLIDGALYLILYNRMLSTQRLHLNNLHRSPSSESTVPEQVPFDQKQMKVLARIYSVIRKT